MKTILLATSILCCVACTGVSHVPMEPLDTVKGRALVLTTVRDVQPFLSVAQASWIERCDYHATLTEEETRGIQAFQEYAYTNCRHVTDYQFSNGHR